MAARRASTAFQSKKLRDTPLQRTQVGPTTLRASAVGLSRPTEGGSRRRGGAELLLLGEQCWAQRPSNACR
eukprot:scaffold54662_cov60-Phaeocystis_antarctica.AAC.3